MKYLSTILERSLLGLFTLCFAFVCLYVPHNFNEVKQVEAGGSMSGFSTEVTQLLNNFELIGVNAQTSISAAADTITSGMTTASFTLDNVVDGIAWSLAKSILSQITSSIINWVNSGFQGSPAFVTDMQGLLLSTADKAFGEYLEDLGGPFSFLCSPFQLDVQIALAIAYDYERANGGIPTPSTCTLTGAVANLEKFLDQTATFTEGGGWDAWFAISAEPNKYTPYGELLEAKTQASIKITNAKGEQKELLSFGQGFLSAKVCESIEGPSKPKEKCKITTPGKVINEALTFQTSAGERSLIEADEINEIISATFAQLTTKAITGAAGLLGLSANTGYTDYSDGAPFADRVGNEDPTSNPAEILAMMQDSLSTEQAYKSAIIDYESQLEDFANNPLNDANKRALAQKELGAMPALETSVNNNISSLNNLITDYGNLPDPKNDPIGLQAITSQYFKLQLHTMQEVTSKKSYWQSLLE